MAALLIPEGILAWAIRQYLVTGSLAEELQKAAEEHQNIGNEVHYNVCLVLLYSKWKGDAGDQERMLNDISELKELLPTNYMQRDHFESPAPVLDFYEQFRT